MALVWKLVHSAFQICELSKLKEIPGLDGAAAQVLGPQIAPMLQALAGMGSRSAAAEAPKQQHGAIVIQGLGK